MKDTQESSAGSRDPTFVTGRECEVTFDVRKVKKGISFLCVSGPHLSPPDLLVYSRTRIFCLGMPYILETYLLSKSTLLLFIAGKLFHCLFLVGRETLLFF